MDDQEGAVRYGASEADWNAWIEVGAAEYLLPAVGNPNAVISPNSKIKDVGKTPSVYNSQGHAVGMAGWTSHVASDADIARWKRQPDYSLALQTAGPVKAIDIDVADKAKAQELRRAITDMIGPTPVRYRELIGKVLIPFWYEGEMPKRVLPVEGGMIEFLGTGQQFIGHGLHPSGVRYQWNGTALPEMPTLDSEALEALWDALVLVHGTGEPRIARTRRAGSGGGESKDLDEVGRWLIDNYEVYDVDQATSAVYVRCPFEAEHTTEDASGTRTAYFSAGSGGYEQGHWRCLGAHCEGRTDAEFLDATGYSLAQFSDLGIDEAEGGSAGPDGDREGQASSLVVDGLAEIRLRRDKTGILPTAGNMVAMCREPSWIGRVLAYDAFRDEMVWCPQGSTPGDEQWQAFGDNDTVDVLTELEDRGMKPPAAALLRSCIRRAACHNRIDTAQEWLGRLRWDGVSRVASFAELGWGWVPSEYAVAVSSYVWTALAGRILEPGCQADMMPVLVGAQGLQKTSAIKAMVPHEDFYESIDLKHRDTDTARLMRGKLIAELEELRGINSQDIESIKAWISRRVESWIPKFVEYSTRFKRRLVLVGSTNEGEILGDATGERRFLPGVCERPLDVAWIRTWRDQLWAEGAVLFAVDGVAWRDAETLAVLEHGAFKINDVWEAAVERWMTTPPVSLAGDSMAPIEQGVARIGDVLRDALGIPESQQDRSKEMRMGRVLSARGDWIYCALPGQGRGWISAKALERVRLDAS